MQTLIGGKEYTVISEEGKKLLREVYGALWIEAVYDPASKQLQEFCKPLNEKMKILNAELRFKE